MKKFLILLFSLQRFAGICQINSSGTNTVSVPIYNLTEGNVSVPIVLNYDATGIQVGFNASNIGQNWNLQAGGKITRIVRDKPDEISFRDRPDFKRDFFGKIYRKNANITEPFLYLKDLENDIFNLNLNGKSISFIIDNANSPTTSLEACLSFNKNIRILNNIENVKIEFMQYRNGNIFNQNECFGSSDIDNRITKKQVPEVLVLEKQLRDSPDDGISIQDCVIQYFRVTLEDGSQYYFGETERDREYSFTFNALKEVQDFDGELFSNAAIIYPHSWVLSRIIIPQGNESVERGPNIGNKTQEIKFNYERKISLLESNFYSSPFKLFINGQTNCVPSQHFEIEVEKKPIIFESILKNIESENYSITMNSLDVFNLKNTIQNNNKIPDFNITDFDNILREDINGWTTPINSNLPQAIQDLSNITKPDILKNIYIKDKITSKAIAYYFDQNYFRTYNYFSSIVPKEINPKGRLKLNGVYQIKLSNSPNFESGYQFFYNEGILPNTKSFARDHWGFYNGEYDNIEKSGLIEVPDDLTLTQALFGGNYNCNTNPDRSNLDANFEFSKVGILSKMISPLSSIVEYDYELNECDNYFEYKKIDVNLNIFKEGVKKVGGLRIKQISTLDPITGVVLKTKYNYLQENSTISSGVLNLWPTYFYQHDNGLYCVPNRYTDMLGRFINSNYITYSRIKEETFGQLNGEVSLGYKVYDFFTNDFNDSNCPYQIFSAGIWKNDGPNVLGRAYSRYRNSSIIPQTNPKVGILKSLKVFNTSNVLLESTLNIFEGEVAASNISQTYLAYPYYGCSKPKYGDNEPFDFNQYSIPHLSTFKKGVAFVKGNLESKIINAVLPSVVAQQLTVIGYIQFGIDLINKHSEVEDCSIYNPIIYNLDLFKLRPFKTIKTIFDNNGQNPIVTTITMSYEPYNLHNSVVKTVTEVSNSDDIISTVENNIKYNKDYTIPISNTNLEALGIDALNKRNMLVPIETYTVKDGKVIGGTINHYYSDVSKEGFVKKTYSLELAKPINLASFTPSLVNPSSGVFTTDPNYRVTAKFNSYNERGLVTEIENVKEFKENTNTPGVEFIQSKTTIGYTHNNLIKSSVTTQGLGSDTRTTTYESIPLFGETSRTLPNNDVVKTEYDDLGRVKFIRDKDENILKSYIYNDKIPSSSLSFSINNGTETLLTLEDVGSYEKTILAGQTSLALKSDLIGFGAKSVQLKFTNPAGVTTTVNSSNTTQSIFYSDISNQTWNIGGYYVEVLAYRGENTQGDIVGRRKIFFNIIDSTINQQRTIKPKN